MELSVNTLVVVSGTAILGGAAGAVGSLALLRRRALVGDALAHAALPGICLAFIVFQSKNLMLLLAGALLSCLLAGIVIVLASGYRRLSEDTLIGVVLSSFFGIGICLSRIIQDNSGSAGIDSFILGRTASMLTSDAKLIGIVSLLLIGLILLLKKELVLISFDREFAASTGWPVRLLDAALIGALVVTMLVGLQAVGVVLIIALLITPPAAARLVTKSVSSLMAVSSGIGLLSAVGGSLISAEFPNMPTGPVIVLCAAALFALCALWKQKTDE
jgi:manganese/zinc/iron transport system permease protein